LNNYDFGHVQISGWWWNINDVRNCYQPRYFINNVRSVLQKKRKMCCAKRAHISWQWFITGFYVKHTHRKLHACKRIHLVKRVFCEHIILYIENVWYKTKYRLFFDKERIVNCVIFKCLNQYLHFWIRDTGYLNFKYMMLWMTKSSSCVLSNFQNMEYKKYPVFTLYIVQLIVSYTMWRIYLIFIVRETNVINLLHARSLKIHRKGR